MPLPILFALAIHQSKDSTADFLGMTPTQIVKMGRSKWYDYYTKKKGSTIVDVIHADRSFANALEQVDDVEMKGLPEARRTWLIKLRKTADSYAFDCYDLGESISMRSEVWRYMLATVPADVEELVQACMRNTHSTKHPSTSFDLDFKLLDKAIKQAPVEAKQDSDFGDYKEAPKYKAKLLADHKVLQGLLKQGTDPNQRRILQFMHEFLEVARAKDRP